MQKAKQIKCKNCSYDLDKGIRKCPYCGILNPTIQLKEIFTMIFAVIAAMAVITIIVNISK